MLKSGFFWAATLLSIGAATPMPIGKKKVVLLGDSITAGFGIAPESAFPALLEKRLISEKLSVEIIAAGVSGSTSASGPARIAWILKSKPDVVVLELGANDGLRGQNVDGIKENLRKTVRLAKAQHVKVVLVGMKLPGNYGKDYNKKFESMFGTLADEEKIAFIPFFFDQLKTTTKLVQADGLHPNEEGHKMIAEKIYPFLLKFL